MSQPESGPGAAPEGIQCPAGQVPKLQPDGSTKCVPVSQESDTDAVATDGVTASLGLTQRIERTVKEYFSQMEKNLDKLIDKKLETIVAQKEKQVEDQLRKSFGLDEDRPVHMSDLEAFGRKLRLEAADPSKRTAISKDAVGPQGNTKETASTQSGQIDSLLKEYGVKKP